MLLEIENLHVSVNEKAILKGLNLRIGTGEVHAIMGPNGAGKSTLGNILAGKEGYTVTDGQLHFDNQNLLDLSIEERSLAGIFLAFQYPVAIPGVSNIQFLKAIVNSHRKRKQLPELDAFEFFNDVKKRLKQLNMKEELLSRSVNDGFSGGEKKRNEILQMQLLEPTLAVLDETDSGLDIDALKIVADGVNSMRDGRRSFIVITHYQRLLDYIKPDFVHVLADGKIIKSGDASLALTLEAQGYQWLEAHHD